MGTRVVDSRKQNKEKKRHASPAGIKKDRKSKHRAVAGVETPTNAKIRIPKVGKIQQGKSEKTQRKKGRDQCHSQGIQNASPK